MGLVLSIDSWGSGAKPAEARHRGKAQGARGQGGYHTSDRGAILPVTSTSYEVLSERHLSVPDGLAPGSGFFLEDPLFTGAVRYNQLMPEEAGGRGRQGKGRVGAHVEFGANPPPC